MGIQCGYPNCYNRLPCARLAGVGRRQLETAPGLMDMVCGGRGLEGGHASMHACACVSMHGNCEHTCMYVHMLTCAHTCMPAPAPTQS